MKARTFKDIKEKGNQLRRKLIIDAAERLFAKNTFHEISLKDIAEEAQISVASIYTYFKSHEDLLLDVLDRSKASLMESINSTLDKKSLNYEDIACICVDYLLDNEAPFQIICLFMTRGNRNCDMLDKFKGIKESFLELFGETLKKAGIDSDNRIFSDALFASLIGIVITYREDASVKDKKQREYIKKLASFSAAALGAASEDKRG